MKIALSIKLAVLTCVTLPAIAQVSAPLLMSVPTPAAEAVAAPERLTLHGMTPDGRRVLLSATSDRWLPNDTNDALDTFVLDRTTGQRTAISVTSANTTGNGTSYASGLSETGGRVAFVSRASDLFGGDDNHTWDVGVRDVGAGTNLLVSISSDGTTSVAPALEPWLAADGRFVVFRSAATDLAPNRLWAGENLYRHDLDGRQTVCLTAAAAGVLTPGHRLVEYTVTPGGSALVLIANAAAGAGPASNLVALLDLPSGTWSNCTRRLPAEVLGGAGTTPELRWAALSRSGRRVTFRSEVSMGADARKYALCYHDLDAGNTVALTLRTNESLRQVFPTDAFQAELSADGRHVTFTAFPAGSSNRTNHMQLYLLDS